MNPPEHAAMKPGATARWTTEPLNYGHLPRNGFEFWMDIMIAMHRPDYFRQVDAAALLGVTERSIRRYIKGERRIPVAVATKMTVAVQGKGTCITRAAWPDYFDDALEFFVTLMQGRAPNFADQTGPIEEDHHPGRARNEPDRMHNQLENEPDRMRNQLENKPDRMRNQLENKPDRMRNQLENEPDRARNQPDQASHRASNQLDRPRKRWLSLLWS